MTFEWDAAKDATNRSKHGLSFEQAQDAFLDPKRVIARDVAHSGTEKRYYCFGKVGDGIATVRFTIRRRRIRISGAGYWRKGRAAYEKANEIHG
jgi:hypothetical protein